MRGEPSSGRSRGELEAVIRKAKERAERIEQPSHLWDLEHYLTRRRQEIDRKYDYRYSVLPLCLRRPSPRRPHLQGRSERPRRGQARLGPPRIGRQRFFLDDRGECCFGFAVYGLYALENLPHAFPVPFACDQNTGIEDQSHSAKSRGLRFRMISSRSAANSGSILGS